MPDGKVIYLMHMGRIFIGNAVFETVVEETSGKEAIDVLVEIANAYEFIPIATIIQDSRGQISGTAAANAIMKVGTIITIPDEAVVAELANDSPYYKDYVRTTTGINVVGPGQASAAPIPPSSFKRGAH